MVNFNKYKMKIEKFTKNTNYLIKSINLSESDKSKISSLGIEEGAIITFYKKSFFGYPLAFLVNNRILTLDQKLVKNLKLEKIQNNNEIKNTSR